MANFIAKPFLHLSSVIGASPDELKLIFSLLVSYPLAAILKRIPDSRPERKTAFIIGTSLFYLIGLFNLWDGLRTLAISASGTYLIAKFLRSSPYMPWVGFTFVMGHLSVSHIIRQYANDPHAIDITGAQMVLVMKLSAFCWNVADGQLPPEQLSPEQKDLMITKLPSILNFMGYVLFFPSLMAGPSFDYVDYQRWIDTTMFNVPAEVDPIKRPPVRKKRKIPRSGVPASLKAATGVTWIGLFVYFSGLYGYEQLTQPEFTSFGFAHRVWISYMVGFTTRMKYYGVWTLTEGACIIAGMGYNGVDPITGKVSWNRLQNIDPWRVETAQNPRAYLSGWNMNTNRWLRNYVYLRVIPRGKKPGFRASLLTFGTSALWHGFHPGYYLTFILGSLIQTVAKNFRRYIRPHFLEPGTGTPTSYKIYYDIASWLVTQMAFSFAVLPFLILSISGSLLVWARLYFYVLIMVILSMAFFASPGKDYLRAQVEQRQRTAGVKLTRSSSQDSLTGREPVLGLSADPERDISEAVAELKADMNELRRRTLPAS